MPYEHMTMEERMQILCEEGEVRTRESEYIVERVKELARQVDEITLIGSQRRGRASARKENVSPVRRNPPSPPLHIMTPTPISPAPVTRTPERVPHYEIGQRIAAAVDLSVRGVKVVSCGTLGTVKGPSDDPNLPTGLNVLWDQRLDSSKRRINTAVEDVTLIS
eukprot:TRINITY_DN1674_c0_g1_i10.p1 TRINITY_DN1674_c0_g1~~TRINITY_DN1674_c0_g1_i10.p1  ORF type:complete len:164 (+),score=24.44 TRINITY_DN1674_c0_g1_i10:127-618(+)